jgi:RHH-type proline utilization regulon transcriptional repressor/proline dehydrogenase/delta 1-pyrroline-5-carboxylate dehydrogenase
MGQVSAALAAGNVVLAKPAEQTCLIGAMAVAALHRAGVPEDVVQLVPGPGETVGAQLVASPAIHGVMFTGSTEVSRIIAHTLSDRLDRAGRLIPLIAETGGQNAMIVDSSALAEQVVLDVLSSAFDSAGQRCSALRVLCLQDDCADHVMTMLRGAMRELEVGNPALLSTDVGPVIDARARDTLCTHVQAMRKAGHRVDALELDDSLRNGTFVAPAIIEIDDIAELKREVFGPILHVLRYRRNRLDGLIDAINASGYGLTFGVHTRLDETVRHVTRRIRAGNIYVNRNIVGAVVGVQPFGGEGLSGTGPKAGGPLYLHRLLSRGPGGLPAALAPVQDAEPIALVGPTGESNQYHLKPRGVVLCVAQTPAGIQAQHDACLLSGNQMLIVDTPAGSAFYEKAGVAAPQRALIRAEDLGRADFQAVLFEGDGDALRALNQEIARREGPLVPVQGRRSDELAAGAGYALETLVREVSVSINTAAAGGNASLMMIG